VLIGGVTGSGKSGVLNVIVAELSARPDVVLWGLDMKHGLEYFPWRPVLNRLATSESAAVELLAAANRILDVRVEQMAGRGERRWRPTPVTPALVIVADELVELGSKALMHCERLARLGRAVAIIVVAATQRPSAAALGGLDARAQMTARIALGVIEARDGELILGTGRIGAGWRPDKLSAPGSFLILAPGQHDQPRRARAYWLSDDAVTAATGRPGAARPELDPVSADGAAGRQEPAEQTTGTAPAAPDPDASLMVALDAAPPGGLSADELAVQLGRSRAWVYKRLLVDRKAGRAVALRRGRWAARRAGRPKETL
jgi:S-DNA-T family DNA segregation ATPase FtsK/SpoIIIE